MEHSVWVFIHVLLLVYWLGADLGVLLLARAAKRSDLSFAERAFALRMALTIDLTPRLCSAAMFPVGLHVTASLGLVDVPGWVFAVAWGVAVGWVLLLLAMGRAEATPRGAALGRLNLALQGVLLVVIGWYGIQAVLGNGPLPGGWFGWKIVLFALIFAMSIGIDIAFRPVGPAFARLAAEGSRPDIEAAISAAVDGAIRYVLALYALLVAIAFLGVAKPF